MNRAIMSELVRLYREIELGMKLPAYDGRKGLYTAGYLPFNSKEFVVKLVERDGSIGIARSVAIVLISLSSCFLFLPAISMQKVINGCTVNHWARINFSRGVQENAAFGFCQELAQMCQISGMVIFP
ncbi:hypothetical protein B296_00001709 [Ensete ventricosum]|uniref:Protein argonaute N-terminal domain-containing protein n=1 Tax=Ensete ventricosum TaxID=4639 RepID=A0A427B4X1_ENSVE|nr:hypothetical protein B296_00001709 [Ensete ventricosum]